MASTAAKKPRTRVFSWRDLVIKADPTWPSDRRKHVMWEFSNGREFIINPDKFGPYE